MNLKYLPLVAALGLTLSACTPKEMFSAAVKVGQVVWDPSVQVGDAKDQPTQIAFSLYASPTTNPNPNSVPPEQEEPEEYSLTLKAESQEALLEQVRETLTQMEGQNITGEEVSPLPSSSPAAAAERGPASGTRQVIWFRVLDGQEHTRDPILIEVPGSGASGILMADRSPAAPVAGQTAAQATAPATASAATSATTAAGSGAGAPYPLRDESGMLPASVTEAERLHSLQVGEYGGRASNDALVVDAGEDNLTGTAAIPVSEYPPAMARAIATPVSFKVLQLTDDSMFLNADVDSLAADIRKALGSTYIKVDDYVLQPGQFKYIDFKKIDSDTRYIAVFAQFHEMNGATWKRAIPVAAQGRMYRLLVGFDSNTVTLQDEGVDESK